MTATSKFDRISERVHRQKTQTKFVGFWVEPSDFELLDELCSELRTSRSEVLRAATQQLIYDFLKRRNTP
jgi:Ribbon-helix-helix protein, copG family